jgi:hypothetical protein
MRIKKLFRGVFNYGHTVHVAYCYAFTERQAWVVFCRRIAKQDGVVPSVVMNTFDGSKDNYAIAIEVEFKEEGR